ncbi:MAG: SPOR domain-containing protein [Bacteroidales bacterium]|nr:SPOR domain-containing protein [Bacteroidales bacterium]
MNRFLKVLLILVPAVFMMTGCDFFRKMAGRPTSRDIAAMAESIRLEEQAFRAREDSIATVRSVAVDSAAIAAALDTLSHMSVIPSTRFKNMDLTGIPHYSIVLGAFSVEDNARKLASQISEKGFEARTLTFGNGFTGVGVCCTDDPVALIESFRKVSRQDFCPTSVWILETIHK